MPPLIAALAKAGLGLIGNAVLAKGKDVVQETLGVDIEASMGTEQGRIELARLQVEKEGQLHQFVLAQREQELRADELADKNTASARDMNARIQESSNAGRLAKSAAYVLDFLIVGATLLLAGMLLFRAIPAENRDIAFAVFGSLLTLCGTVVNFHRGTSASSRSKDDAIHSALQRTAS